MVGTPFGWAFFVVLFDFGIHALFQFFEIAGKKFVKALLLGFAAGEDSAEAVLKAFVVPKSVQSQEGLQGEGFLCRAGR